MRNVLESLADTLALGQVSPDRLTQMDLFAAADQSLFLERHPQTESDARGGIGPSVRGFAKRPEHIARRRVLWPG
jgi:hypothetical protein